MHNFHLGIKYLFIMYLMVFSNFLGTFFGKHVQQLLHNNRFIKHMIGFVAMIFFVSIVEKETFWSAQHILFFGVIYVVFVFSTKMDFKMWSIFMIILTLAYLVLIFKDTGKENMSSSQIYDDKHEKLKKGLIYVSVALVSVVIFYYTSENKFSILLKKCSDESAISHFFPSIVKTK